MTKNEGKLRLAQGFRLQWEEAQKTWVLLYPEGMIQVNESCAEILKLCDGKHSALELLNKLSAQFPGENISNDVNQLIEDFSAHGWITTDPT